MGGGTEEFPELGRHCHNSDCKQLDFLPFTCDGCSKVYCLEHRTYKSHECPKSEHKIRRVVVCQICSTSMEITGKENKEFKEEEKILLERHEKSGDCDPKMKKKPKCPVKRCNEILTFSNISTCKICQVKVCLSHRFPSDHDCKKRVSSVGSNGVGGGTGGGLGNKFLAAFVARNAKACGSKKNNSMASSSSSSSVKAH